MKRCDQVLLLACGLALAAASMGGCQQTLFSDSDAYTKSRIDRYYDRDSATETAESRKRAGEMGFGFPGGAANQ